MSIDSKSKDCGTRSGQATLASSRSEHNELSPEVETHLFMHKTPFSLPRPMSPYMASATSLRTLSASNSTRFHPFNNRMCVLLSYLPSRDPTSTQHICWLGLGLLRRSLIQGHKLSTNVLQNFCQIDPDMNRVSTLILLIIDRNNSSHSPVECIHWNSQHQCFVRRKECRLQ